MPPQGRIGDNGKIDNDAHGCPACPHPCVGPVISGSPDVFANSLPTTRVDDAGVHAACCGPNLYVNAKGSGTVFINGKAAHRKDDNQTHCGGTGKLIAGSPDVITGG